MNILLYRNISLKDLPEVGGKNASLGEMIMNLSSIGIQVPEGFAITASAYRNFISANKIADKLDELISRLDTREFNNLSETGKACRELIMKSKFSEELKKEILDFYHELGDSVTVAGRSSATAEDRPGASFAGQHDSFLNIRGNENLLQACKKCFASLYNDRAIKYRALKGFENKKIALSVGVQKMVRADLASAGVAFTIDPETGFQDMIYITGVWGLGENIVQGAVTPDEFYFFKPSLRKNKKALITKRLGEKALTMVFENGDQGEKSIRNNKTEKEKQLSFVLSDDECLQLAVWCDEIEKHYKMPMDIEWAKDGESGLLYILQARPETIHGTEKAAVIKEYVLTEKGKVITKGKAVGGKIVSGIARILKSPQEGHKLNPGEILIAETTNPDWNAIMKKASVIVTDKGGRTSHASIVARELGLSAVVGTINATTAIKDGQEITVSCAEGDTGKVYEGLLKWEEKNIALDNFEMPETDPMFILADPGVALKYSSYPNRGVGLLRMEFIINNHVRVHPMALINFDQLKDEKVKDEIDELCKGYENRSDYFIDQLSQGIAMVAAAFYPKDVIVRMSDFKTNEYAELLGGKQFEPEEENPMIGFRGASRYYNERYREGFRLECLAMKVVREEMGFENVKLMIPFCRTVDEGKRVVNLMEEFGLKRGGKELEIYMMTEIPANVILAEQFAEIFDGFSIGSNDLTQLTLGIDRDSEIISDLFDERNEAAKWIIATAIQKAKTAGIKIGLCGQAPSDFPEFARFLVDEGIDSISFNPDAILRGIDNIHKAEVELLRLND